MPPMLLMQGVLLLNKRNRVTADVVTSGIWVLLSVIAEDFIADISVVNQLIENGHILGGVAQ